MITRYLASAAIGFAVTAGLLFLMHILIEISEAVESIPRNRINLTFIPTLDDTPVEIGKQKPAIDAACRFRYNARVVHGTPVATGGIRKQFRFEMEQD